MLTEKRRLGVVQPPKRMEELRRAEGIEGHPPNSAGEWSDPRGQSHNFRVHKEPPIPQLEHTWDNQATSTSVQLAGLLSTVAAHAAGDGAIGSLREVQLMEGFNKHILVRNFIFL